MADEQSGGPVCCVRECGKRAPHKWGKAEFCCEHFDKLVSDIFGLQEAIIARRHQDLVDYFESTLGRRSKPEGQKCDDDEGGEKK